MRSIQTRRGTKLWQHACEMAARWQAEYAPEDEPFDLEQLTNRPLTAQNFFDARRSFLKQVMPQLQALFEDGAVQAAIEVGYADPNGEGSINNLVRERVISSDGKVVKPTGSRYELLTDKQLTEAHKKSQKITKEGFVLDKLTGEIVARKDTIGEQLYKTGGGLKHGHKYVGSSIRDDHPNSTIITTMRLQQTDNEAQEMTDAVLDVKRKLPGLLGATSDAAIRGDQIRQLMRAGLVPIAPIAPIAAAKILENGTRVEKTGLVEIEPHDHPHGFRCEHRIDYHGGHIGEFQIADDGTKEFASFGALKAEPRPRKDHIRMYGTTRLYCGVGMPGGELISVRDLRYDLTAETEGKNGLNYAENENRQRDDERWDGRGRSRTAERQLWNEIGGCLVQNGVAVLMHRKRVADGTVNKPKHHKPKVKAPPALPDETVGLEAA
jgi:hypothetical protein